MHVLEVVSSLQQCGAFSAAPVRQTALAVGLWGWLDCKQATEFNPLQDRQARHIISKTPILKSFGQESLWTAFCTIEHSKPQKME